LDYAGSHGQVTDVINQDMDIQVEEFSRELIAKQARMAKPGPNKSLKRKSK
jgi:hypothetical protein